MIWITEKPRRDCISCITSYVRPIYPV